MASFFNWFLLSITIGASFVVYVSTKVGWDTGFTISVCCSFVGLLFIALGNPFYRVRVPVLRGLDVLVVIVKNCRTKPPQNLDELYEMRDRESTSSGELIPHSNQFKQISGRGSNFP